VPQDSFFKFFDNYQMPSDQQLKDGELKITRQDLEHETKDEPVAKDGEEEPDSKPNYVEEDVGERLDFEYQLGQDFKNELIPLSYEYYLNII